MDLGFYTTTFENQAKDWAIRKSQALRNLQELKTKGNSEIKAVVSKYELDFEYVKEILNIKEFDKINDDWIDFVLQNRKQTNLVHNYDIVIGEVANDKVFKAIEYYTDGVITREQLKEQLKYKEENNQVSFHTMESLKLLKFLESYEVS
ncbi:MAG: DUF3990 domain-containing protein [Firmicutes bacterium]|nr:DUF3990 domain-containing protein [Bacillota bacterium]